jgi:hypothetical protein
MTRGRRRVLPILVAACALVGASMRAPARAGNPVDVGSASASGSAAPSSTPEDRARARELFKEGLELFEKGDYAAACVKFEECEALAPMPQVRFNLATCWEKIDRTASAWSLFLVVADDFKAAGNDAREKDARSHAAALEPKLIKLTVAVSAGNPKTIDVRRNDVGIVTGVATPVDPGTHVLTAKAVGYTTWTKKVSLQVPGSTTTVTVPVLGK